MIRHFLSILYFNYALPIFRVDMVYICIVQILAVLGLNNRNKSKYSYQTAHILFLHSLHIPLNLLSEKRALSRLMFIWNFDIAGFILNFKFNHIRCAGTLFWNNMITCIIKRICSTLYKINLNILATNILIVKWKNVYDILFELVQIPVWVSRIKVYWESIDK